MLTAGEERRSRAARFAAVAIPWLMSTTAHVTLLIVFAVTLFRADGGGLGARSSLPIDLVAALETTGPALDDGGTVAAMANLADDGSTAPNDSSSESSDLAELPGEAPPIEIAKPTAVPLATGEVKLPPTAATGATRSGDLDAQARRLAAALGGKGQRAGSPGSSRRGRGDYGGKARTQVFGLAGEGYSFAYVFDRSGSMSGYGGAPLAAAKSELLASLNDLSATHQFQIIFYNEEPREFNPTGTPGRLAFANDANKEAAARFVRSIAADGATGHEEALLAGLRMGPDVLFFLTDADEPRMSAGQLQRIARANKGTIIYAVEFGFGVQADSRNFLVRIAEASGGSHVYVDISRLPEP